MHRWQNVATQLEKAWEAALQRVETCRQRLDGMLEPDAGDARPDLTGLAADLSAAWKAPRTTMRTRQLPPRFRTIDYVRDWLPIRRERCAKHV